MNQGKTICKHLKEIRQEIARENDIPLESKECTYEGPCNGTCPHCEAELRFLEEELSRRSQLGKAAVVAGMTLGMVATAQNVCAQSDNRHEMLMGDVVAEIPVDTTTVTGFVYDGENGNKIIAANVVLTRKGDSTPCVETITDSNGFFKAELPYGNYVVDVNCVGYLSRKVSLDVSKKEMQATPIEMRRREEMLMGIVPYTPQVPKHGEEQEPTEKSN